MLVCLFVGRKCLENMGVYILSIANEYYLRAVELILCGERH